MAKTVNLDPIETYEEAALNPGGDELDTHVQHEPVIIHSANQIIKSQLEIDVTEKLTGLIKGYYQSPIGVYPLDEFFFGITDTEIRIYDRWGVYLISGGRGSFTEEEVVWVQENLPIYMTGEEIKDPSKVHLDFLPLRKDGWTVWRRSGTFNNIIGYIRRNLDHMHHPSEAEYHFDERIDNIIISDLEYDIINKFIGNTIPFVDVTNIVVDYSTVVLKLNESKQLTIWVYPVNATDKELNTSITNPAVCTYENNTIYYKDEGIANLILTSHSNPAVTTVIGITCIQYDHLINNKYDIENTTDPETGMEFSYMSIDKNMSISQLLKTFKNKEENLTVYDYMGYEIPMEMYSRIASTGIRIELYSNNQKYDEVSIVVLGDINQDGFINEYDVQYIRDYVNGARTLSGIEFVAADVNKDGVVDLNDANILEQCIEKDYPPNKLKIKYGNLISNFDFHYAGSIKIYTFATKPLEKGKIYTLWFRDHKAGRSLSVSPDANDHRSMYFQKEYSTIDPAYIMSRFDPEPGDTFPHTFYISTWVYNIEEYKYMPDNELMLVEGTEKPTEFVPYGTQTIEFEDGIN